VGPLPGDPGPQTRRPPRCYRPGPDPHHRWVHPDSSEVLGSGPATARRPERHPGSDRCAVGASTSPCRVGDSGDRSGPRSWSGRGGRGGDRSPTPRRHPPSRRGDPHRSAFPLRPSRPLSHRLRPAAHRRTPMTKITEAAAEAAIVSAATTLFLPTVRAQAAALADAAARDRLTHRGYLAELLATEV